MTTYDKIMEIVDDFKNIETLDEIKNHPKYKEYMEDHVHYNGFDFVQFDSKHLFKFCNRIYFCGKDTDDSILHQLPLVAWIQFS